MNSTSSFESDSDPPIGSDRKGVLIRSKPFGGGGRERGGSWVGYGHMGWVEREIRSRGRGF